MNKNTNWMTLLRYTYQPFHARVLFNQLLGCGRVIANRVPVRAEESPLGCDPVFIVSAGRSGFTLPRRIR